MTQKRWSIDEKVEIVLAVIRGQEPMSRICKHHGVSETAVYRWREQFLEGGRAGLSGGRDGEIEQLRSENEELKTVIGELTVANRILGKAQRL
jgi:transposase-like protein